MAPATMSNFQRLVRAFNAYIKAKHHRQFVGLDPKIPTPMRFRRIEQHLMKAVQPAAGSPAVDALREGNAKNWTVTTIQILQEHYDQILKDLPSVVAPLVAGEDWETALVVAVRWVQRDLRRIRRNVVDKAVADIREIVIRVLADSGVQVARPARSTVKESSAVEPDLEPVQQAKKLKLDQDQKPEAPPTFKSEAPPTFKSEAPPTFKSEAPPTFKSEAPPTFKSEAPPTFKSEAPPTFKSEAPPTFKSEAPSTFKSEAPPTFKTGPLHSCCSSHLNS
ncbi:DNA ligase 1-like isoform X2 [Acanthochromis polyacanthus]|uniref:DNA ligase 1-like isoform X2 n=1 Tax=Acanthochromis polyacanthus TaxID=80966 RepID=UPI002234E643|nr:DNA ligase 1-like isoform X2 [Acanthochromis polyacanthus]